MTFVHTNYITVNGQQHQISAGKPKPFMKMIYYDSAIKPLYGNSALYSMTLYYLTKS